MRRSPRRFVTPIALAASLALAVPFFSVKAHGSEPTAADVESAQSLYKEGKALRDRGELPLALEKFRAAHALVETPITALDLGRTYVALGKLVEARAVLVAVDRIPVRKNETQRATEARTAAEVLAGEIKPKLASLTAKPRGAAPGTSLKISIDDAALPPEAATAPRIVNPGRHVVMLEANGQRTVVEVTLAEGESKDAVVDVPAPVASAAPAPPRPTPPGPRSPLVYIGFGLTAAGVAVGTVTGILTFSTASSVKDACSADGRCPPSERSNIDSGSTTATISTISFAVAGAGALVGVIGLAVGRSKGTQQTSAFVGPGSIGLRGSF